MRDHYHLTVDHVIPTIVIVVVGINIWRIGAAKLAQQPGVAGKIGKGLGALVTFGGAS